MKTLSIDQSEIIEIAQDVSDLLNGNTKFYLGLSQRELTDAIAHAVDNGDHGVVDAFIIATECANVDRLKELVGKL